MAISRQKLATLLDVENYPLHADRILRGEDPSIVLGELRPLIPPADGRPHPNYITLVMVARRELEVT